LIEDPAKDKSAIYGFDLPKGTWMISMKVNNPDVWAKVKAGEVKGFSIEGYFADKLDLASVRTMEEEREYLIEQIKNVLRGKELAEESYNDYPSVVKRTHSVVLHSMKGMATSVLHRWVRYELNS
jgi:hypothetical protein